MRFSRLRFSLPTLLIASTTILAAGVLATSLGFSPVPDSPNPNPRVAGLSSPNVFPPELTAVIAARGSNAVENPVAGGVTVPNGCPAVSSSALHLAPDADKLLSIGFYGYDTTLAGSPLAFVDGPMIPAAGDTPDGHRVEATKTEADENTFLELHNQHGPTSGYDYGDDFLYQGHELGRGFITRINLEADGPHRVTVLADHDSNGCPLPTIDGSGWDPFNRRLLFTSESAGNQSILQATPDYPSTVDDLTSPMGHGAYEAVVVDNDHRIYLVEDAGGNTGSNATGTVTDGSGSVPPPGVDLSHTKQSNSFVFRFIPYPGSNLLTSGGELQVLQVESGSFASPGAPITFTAPAAPGTSQHDKQLAANHDLLSPNLADLHTYGKTFKTKWITIHKTDTATCPLGPAKCPSWNANTLAKSMGGTPFKRPENGRFRPGSDFKEFYFGETGDTDNTTAGPLYGGFGAIYKLELLWGDTGKLSLLYNAQNAVHSGFDNVAFWDTDHLAVVEDAGDTLHGQRNSLDNTWLFNVKTDYSVLTRQPARLMAEGRDPSATIDAGISAFAVPAGHTKQFQNEGDNEITGWITSDGDPSIWGLLGAKRFSAFQAGYRTFFTQQHGDNITWEVVRSQDSDKIKAKKHYDDDDDDFAHFYGQFFGHGW